MGSKMDDIIKNVNKRAKEEIMSVGLGEFNYDRIPFTSPRMNYCTHGGIPVGKLTELFGAEHCGKTTTALDLIANFQHSKDQRKVLYVDVENTLDTTWARKLGVDVDDLYIIQPKSQSAEEIFQIICDGVDTGEIGLWVLDSIGMLVSAQELEGTLEDKTYGGIAKPLTLFSKRVEMLMQRHKCTGIGINQLRDKVNSTYGGTDTPGGRAWKHCCCVRLQFQMGTYLDEKYTPVSRAVESPAAIRILMSMTKNKTCPPTSRTGFYTLTFDSGIDYIYDLVDVAIKYDIVKKSGGWYDIVDLNTGELINDGKIQGMSNLRQYLEENVDILQQVETQVNTKMGV